MNPRCYLNIVLFVGHFVGYRVAAMKDISQITRTVSVAEGSDLTLSCYSMDRTSSQCCQSDEHEAHAPKAGISHTSWLVGDEMVGRLVETKTFPRPVTNYYQPFHGNGAEKNPVYFPPGRKNWGEPNRLGPRYL